MDKSHSEGQNRSVDYIRLRCKFAAQRQTFAMQENSITWCVVYADVIRWKRGFTHLAQALTTGDPIALKDRFSQIELHGVDRPHAHRLSVRTDKQSRTDSGRRPRF